MAKKFAGFTTEQQKKLLGPLGYTGPAQQDDINKFVMSNPKAASMLGRSADIARARIDIGSKGFQAGGISTTAGIGKVLMDKYGYTEQDGKYFAPAPAAAPAATPESTPAAAPAATPESTPSPIPAATPEPTPTPAATPAPAATSNQAAIDKVLVEKYGYEMVDGKAYPPGKAPTPAPDAPTTPAPDAPTTPAPEPAPQPTGINKILVDKYGWTYDPATDKSYAPGTAPEAPTPAPTPEPAPEPGTEPGTEPTGVDKILVEKYGWEFVDGKSYAPGTAPAPVEGDEAGAAPEEGEGAIPEPAPEEGDGPTLPTINDKVVTNSAPAIGEDGNIIPGVVTVTYGDGSTEQVTIEIANEAGIDTKNIEDLLAKQTADQLILDNVTNYGVVTVVEISPGVFEMVDKNGDRIPGSPRGGGDSGLANLDFWAKSNGFTFSGNSAEESMKTPDSPVETSLVTTTTGASISSVFDPSTKTTTYKVISPEGSVQTFSDFASAEKAMGLFQAKEYDLPGAAEYEYKSPTLEGTEGEFTTEGIRYKSFADPGSIVRQADASKIKQTEAQKIADEEGAAAAIAEQAAAEVAAVPTDIDDQVVPDITEATVTATEADVKTTVNTLVAATGKPSTEALAEAANMSPQELAQLGLTAAQIEEAIQVQAPDKRVEMTGEMIEGPTVDMERVKEAVNFEAATGAPSTDATVQGQLTKLMADFEDGEPPSWAAGAMRTAAATMSARGLGSSSLAAQAIVQAAMESALPIAMQDAQTVAGFEAQNLSNRQQTAMFAAEQRAKFLGMEFDQAFQTRVQNAAKIADIANMNFTAEQQVALENARITSTTDIANLNASNAKVLADAAAMSQIDVTNLSNNMKANVQKAEAFLQTDMSNLSNEQQAAIFKTQALVNSILSDAGAENAKSQFNAASQNQLDQFIANISNDIDKFNSEQQNAIAMFNAGEENAIEQFNTAQQNARDQFNAQNSLIIAQSNAAWQQAIATADTAADNQAIREGVMAKNNLTMQAYANMIQAERDILDYAWRSTESLLQRESAITVAELNNKAQADTVKGTAMGALTATASKFFLSKILNVPI